MKAIFKIFVIMITMLTSAMQASNIAAVKGSVLGENGEPLMDANVTIPGTSLGSATDEEGNFFIEGLKPGAYRVMCEYIGYIPTIAENVEVMADDIATVYFQLIPDNMAVEKLIVKVNWDKVKNPEDVIGYRFYKPVIMTILADTVNLSGVDLNGKPLNTEVGFFEKMRWYFWRMFN